MALGASLLAPERQKGMKGKKTKGISRTAEKTWVSARVTQAEKLLLKNQAEIAGLSLSEFLRRNFLGGKPLVAHTDLKILMELRRVGGLLKYNFTAMRDCHAPFDVWAKMDGAFAELCKLMEKISHSFHDS